MAANFSHADLLPRVNVLSRFQVTLSYHLRPRKVLYWSACAMFTAFRERLGRSANRLRASKQFVICKKASAMVEFGLVAAPFFALLMALFQTALVFFAGRVLDVTTLQASRYILTGQAQNANYTQANFATYVCNNTFALFNCNNFMINVQTYSTWSSSTCTSPTLTYNSHGQVTNTWTYNPGGPSQIVVVQVMYQWPVVLGPLGFNLSNLSNGDRLLMSCAVFRVEPY
jgi:Flp pilus assembly protein TadG